MTLTDFQPKYSIEKGLQTTCEWFAESANLKKYKLNIYNV